MQVFLNLLVFVFIIQVVSCATCNIEKRDWSEIETYHSSDDFPQIPIVFSAQAGENVDRQVALQMVSTREYLMSEFNSTEVTVSSSNTYSDGLYHMRLNEYISHMTSGDDSRDKANESYYFFGNNNDGIWSTMSDLYINPPCHFCDKAGAKTLGIGGKSSGVSFHFHGLGFSEVIIGKKRWYLFPPSLTPLVNHFSPNSTAAQIMEDITALDPSETLVADDFATRTTGTTGTDGIVSLERDEMDVAPQSKSPSGLIASIPQSVQRNALPLYFTTHPDSMQELRNGLHMCDIGPGEVLYFPPLWMHATTNLDDYNVFYSLFLDPQLMKDV